MNPFIISKSKLALFFYAIGCVFIIQFVGQLMVSEVVVALFLPFIEYKSIINKYKLFRIILIGFFILGFGQIISDFINQTEVKDLARGWSLNLSAFLSTIFLVTYLSKQRANILYYIFILFLIQLIFGYDGGNLNLAEVDDNYFKYRFAPFLNMLALFFSCMYYKRKDQKKAILVLFANSIVSFIFAARSNGLIFLIAGVLLLVKNQNIRFNTKRLISYTLIILPVLYALYIIYANQVVYHGFGGTNSRNQFAMMSNIYNPFELLLYGRSDFFVTLKAISTKPILGLGSWPKDPNGYYENMLNILSGEQIVSESGYIPIHSILLGSWITAGTLGLIGILVIYTTLFKNVKKLYSTKEHIDHLPLIIGLSVDMLWAFLFSPLSLMRSAFPLFAAIIIIEAQKLNLTSKIEKQRTISLIRANYL